MYRVVDIEFGKDLTDNSPVEWQEIRSGDYFDDLRARKWCMLHSAQLDDPNVKKHLLAFSTSMAGIMNVLKSKHENLIDKNPDRFYRDYRQVVAKFDMVAAWVDGAIAHNSYADVSTPPKWKEYMRSRKGWKAEDWAAENLEQNSINNY